eukprot:evm.model.scf_309.1 EVM.evm.TU.scf_309.1   scf_309:4395-8613(+)
MLALRLAPHAPLVGRRAQPPSPKHAPRALPNLHQLLGAQGADPGDWRHSPEWWGTQGGGWGRSDGKIVFRRDSEVGNGQVTVTSHEAYEVPAGGTGGQEGSYHEWRVLRFNDVTRQGVARVMVTPRSDTLSLEEAQPDCLAFEYLKTMAAAGAAVMGGALPTNIRNKCAVLDHLKGWNMLVIGGGAFSLPQFLQHHFPHSSVQAVELDPVVVQAATDHMGISEAASWSLVQGEGVNYVRECCGAGFCWDIIFVDAFDGSDEVPDVLCSSAGLSALSHALHPDHGAVVMNTHGGTISSGYSLSGALPFMRDCGFDRRSAMGQKVLELCGALRAEALGGTGCCATISTMHQDNIVILASRGLRLAENGRAAESTLEGFATTVATATSFPFSVSSRANRNLMIWR